MRTQNHSEYLFTHKLRLVGWILVILSALLFILCINPMKIFGENFDLVDMEIPFFAIYTDNIGEMFNTSANSRHWFTITQTGLFTTFVPVIFLVGALFVCFSKEKVEDELICKIRERSLVWSTMVTFFFLIFCILFFYGFTYLLIKRFVIDLYLIIFYLKFRFELHKINKQ